MVNYKSKATEEEKHEVFQSLKTTKSPKEKKIHSKDGNIENISSTENILNLKVSEESGSKNHKSEKNKRKYEESVVIVDCKEEKLKKKKHKYLKENVESDKNEVPAEKKKPNKLDVEGKENDSKKPANADGKKQRKARHTGREERKKEKAKKKELIANGTITPETKSKKKRKRKSKKNKKDKNSTVSQENITPRPKGDIPLEDASTAEYKAKEFLKTWNKDKTNWKFVKTRQNWLVHHLYDPKKIDDKMFKVALKYLAGMKGYSREITLEQAKSVLNVASGDTTAKIHKKIVLSDKPGEIQLARAREVIQMM